MPFVLDLNPNYASNERALDREQQNRQFMLNMLAQGASTAAGIIQQNKGREQQQSQFEAAQAQQLQEFNARVQYDRDWRDQQLQQKKIDDDAMVRMYSDVTGQKWDGPTPSASILSPMVSKQLQVAAHQAEVNQDNEGKLKYNQMLYAAEQQHWIDYAPTVANKIGRMESLGVLPPEIAQHYIQSIQQSPQMSRVIDTELDKAFTQQMFGELQKMKLQKIGQTLNMWGMDPGFADAFGEEAQQRALIAAKGLEAGVWTDPKDAMSFMFPKMSGTSESERLMAIPEAQRSPEQQRRIDALTYKDRPIKDPQAIGATGADVATLESELANWQDKAKNATDDETRKTAQANVEKIRLRLGDAKGASSRAKAGTPRMANEPKSKTSGMTPQEAYRKAREKLGPQASREDVQAEAQRIYESEN